MPLTFSLAFPFFTKFEPAFKISGVLQMAMFLVASLLLSEGRVVDGPDPGQFFLLASIAYWCAVAIIMFRRNGDATRFDQFLLKWGFPLMIPLTVLVFIVVPVGILRHH